MKALNPFDQLHQRRTRRSALFNGLLQRGLDQQTKEGMCVNASQDRSHKAQIE
jgi:hypothetical protein